MSDTSDTRHTPRHFAPRDDEPQSAGPVPAPQHAYPTPASDDAVAPSDAAAYLSDYERLRLLDDSGPLPAVHLAAPAPQDSATPASPAESAGSAPAPAVHATPATPTDASPVPASPVSTPDDTPAVPSDAEPPAAPARSDDVPAAEPEPEAQSAAAAAAADATPAAGNTGADDANDEQDALAALASDAGVGEVEAPSEEALTAEIRLDDDAPRAGTPIVHRVTHQTLTPEPAPDDGDDTLPLDMSQYAGNAGNPAPSPDELDHIEVAAMATAGNPSQTMPFAPVKPTSRDSVSASTRLSGAARSTGALAWGSRTDVGRVREHNEDSYLVNFPLFAVADGMGGHAAGEVASTIAVSSLAEAGLTKPDPDALGAAIEAANIAVLDGVDEGIGRPGMGTTCTAVVIDGTRMAVGHVGDSRAYLLHEGKLLRVTHDHSFVEELVEAGEITPEEARVHPSRSIITRALGSERSMRADSFLVDVTLGDRILLCSDGLSSMISDDVIEEAMVTSPAPQACADRLVDLALGAGGLDNVTVIVIDVKDDGIERHALLNRIRNVALWLVAVVAVLVAILVGIMVYADHTWYLTDRDGYVTLYKGIPGDYPLVTLSEEIEQTNIRTSQLSETVEERLSRGISFGSEDAARAVLERYRAQLAANESDGVVVGPIASSQADGTSSSEDNVVNAAELMPSQAEPNQAQAPSDSPANAGQDA